MNISAKVDGIPGLCFNGGPVVSYGRYGSSRMLPIELFFFPGALTPGSLHDLVMIFIGLGVIFYLRGDKIQGVVNEKSEVKDVRPATIIDLVYVLILMLFTWVSTVPMSTTWVFIALMGGREQGLKIRRHENW